MKLVFDTWSTPDSTLLARFASLRPCNAMELAGLVFSIAVALLAEELIFGQVFRLFFRPVTVKAPAQDRLREDQKLFTAEGAEYFR